MQIPVYSEFADSPRFRYVVNFLNERLIEKKVFQVFPLENYSENNTFPCIFHSTSSSKKNYNIQASPIFKEGFQEKISFSNYNLIARDPFAVVFFWLSEYETYYLPKDNHRRPGTRYSLRVNLDNFKTPLIQEILSEFLNTISDFFHGKIEIPSKPKRLTLSLDIDHIGYYCYRPFYKTLLSLAKKITFLRFHELYSHLSACLKQKDPLDKVFETLKNIDTELLFFLLLSSAPPYDSRTPYPQKQWKEVVTLLKKHTIGIHPSYFASREEKKLHLEIKNYQQLVGKSPKISRLHYLRKGNPDTYRLLVQAGIRRDYTSLPLHTTGFFHGVTVPFFFYDLQKEEETELEIVPTLAMDRTVKDTMQKNTHTDIVSVYKQLLTEFSKWGGEADLLFHPESIAGIGEWKGWDEVWEFVLAEVQRMNSL